MSLLPNATYANPTTPFFGGGGPTPPSTSNLTSPSLILPGTDSNSFLGLVAPTGANVASLTIDANGGTSEILMNAGAAPASGYEIKTDSFSGNLIVGGLLATLPLVTLNATSHTLALGDGAGSSQVSATAATISLDASLVGTVPTGGVINATSTGASMTTSTNPGVVVNSTQTTVRGNYHYIANLPGTISDASVYTLTSPTQTGLYAITITGNLDPVGILCGVTTLAHFLVGSGYVSGGNNAAILAGGGNSYARLFLTEGVDGKVMNFQYVSGGAAANLIGISCRIVQLTGDVGF